MNARLIAQKLYRDLTATVGYALAPFALAALVMGAMAELLLMVAIMTCPVWLVSTAVCNIAGLPTPLFETLMMYVGIAWAVCATVLAVIFLPLLTGSEKRVSIFD